MLIFAHRGASKAAAEHGNPAIYLTCRGNPLQKWTLGMESTYRP